MIVVLHDWPYELQVIDSWVREQLSALGLEPDGVDNAQLWSCALVHADSERTVESDYPDHVETEWLVEYPLGAIVEHTCPQFGTHTTLYSCPFCSKLTDRGVCPHCGADIIHDTPEAVFQTAEEIEDWFGANTPGMVVQFRCKYCDQFFSVEGAVRHARRTEHTEFHRA